MSLKEKLSTTWAGLVGIFILINLGIMWPIGIVHSYKHHNRGDLIMSIITPFGIYRGYESFWHKDDPIDISNEDSIDWSKRIPDDISTAFDLINYSNDKDDIDNDKMQMEDFSKKINTYPADKKEKIENGVINYLKYNISTSADAVNYLKALSKDSNAVFVYSDVSIKEYDSVYSYYNIPDIQKIKIAVDSMQKTFNYSAFKDIDIKEIIMATNEKIVSFEGNYHTGFKRIFNEDFN